jgi:hypothetical protein
MKPIGLVEWHRLFPSVLRDATRFSQHFFALYEVLLFSDTLCQRGR